METASDTLLPTLRRAGLTESQAKGYLALVEHGTLSPAALAETTGESRTNGYMICEKLETLGLAIKKEGRTALYTATHPSALEKLAEKRRKVVEHNEKAVKDNIGELITHFYRYNSTPGVEFDYGGEGVKKIRQRTLNKKQELLFVRSTSDKQYKHHDLAGFIDKRVAAGIPAQSISPIAPSANPHPDSFIKEQLLHRTLIPKEAYTSPVEIDIFGDTVAFIDFENDSMSTMITSTNIATAMRQLFLLAKQMTEQATNQAALREQLVQVSDRGASHE